VFYNTLNNNAKNVIDNGYRVEFKNTNTTFQDFEQIIKNKRTTFLLEDAIQGMMYIPNDLKSISKEFLMDMNLKTDLIKSELYSSFLREFNIVKFLEDVFAKLNIKDSENIKNISQKVIVLINNFNKVLDENNKLKSVNKILLQDKQNNNLYLKKFKDDVKESMIKLKEKYAHLTSNIDNKVQNIKNSNIILKEKAKKDNDKLRGEILGLRSENNKLRNDIEELKKLLDTQNENEKLYKELEEKEMNDNGRNYRTVPWNSIVRSVPVSSFNYIQPNTVPKIIINNNSRSKILNDNDNDINNNIKNNDYMEDNYNKNLDRSDVNKNNNSNMNNKGSNINKNYHKKKKEINNLKEQIDRVKDEINNIMLNSNNPNFNISDNFLSGTKNTINSESNVNRNINNSNDINSVSYNNKNKNDVTENLYNIINGLQTELNNEKNKNSVMEKEIISLKQYIDNLSDEMAKQQQYINTNAEAMVNKNIFSPKFFIKMFFNINPKIFSSSELKKYYKIYNSQNINTIFEIFGKTCELLKRQIYESHFEIETMNTDIEDNNLINERNIAIDSSYRLVNERILKLKKLEFDFINLSEFVKNYLVGQEIIVKIIFNSDDNIIQFEPIEKLFKLFEDCLNFKIDEMNDNVIFHRKLLIKMLKNQKNCLGMSLESISQ